MTRWVSAAFLSATCSATLTGSGCTPGAPEPAAFDAVRWQSVANEADEAVHAAMLARGRMVEDLLSSRALIGMSRGEASGLLGGGLVQIDSLATTCGFWPGAGPPCPGDCWGYAIAEENAMGLGQGDHGGLLIVGFDAAGAVVDTAYVWFPPWE